MLVLPAIEQLNDRWQTFDDMQFIARSLRTASKASPAPDFAAKNEDASCLMCPSDGDGEFVKLVQLGLYDLLEFPIPTPLKDVTLIGEAEVVVFTGAELHDIVDAGKRFGVARCISSAPNSLATLLGAAAGVR